MKQPFLQLYDDYFDDVYRYVSYKTGSRWDTDDVVSDIFRKAYEKYGSLEQHTNAKAWLMTIARNTVIDYYRRRKQPPADIDLELIAAPDDIGMQLERDEEVGCLKKAIGFLPEPDREVVNLKYFADMKYREIGDTLGMTEQAIKIRAFRLLRKLAALVKQCLEGANSHG